ncbi:MAG: 50S ribosomal protein L15 [Bacillales bacterium]|nr:50S ribosomal protein L15 [Bacillales bacterium]
MALENLKPTEGSLHSKTFVGRGNGCGLGKTSGRGQKGQNSRAGGGTRLGFEGGQTPLYKRIAKRGFTHLQQVKYAIVNVSALESFKAGDVVDKESLKKAGLINKEYSGVKILGEGSLSKALTVKVDKVSVSAKEKIEAVGGTVEVI